MKTRKRVFLLLLAVILTQPAYAGVVSRYHNFAQVADGGEFRTTFLLSNPNATEAEVTLRFRLDDGSPFELSIEDQVTDIFTRKIPGNGMISMSTDRVSASVTTGWAELVADTEIGAQAFFESFSGWN